MKTKVTIEENSNPKDYIYRKGNIIKSNSSDNCILLTKDSPVSSKLISGVTLGQIGIGSYSEVWEKKYFDKLLNGKVILES